jgi:hypothetical protein
MSKKAPRITSVHLTTRGTHLKQENLTTLTEFIHVASAYLTEPVIDTCYTLILTNIKLPHLKDFQAWNRDSEAPLQVADSTASFLPFNFRVEFPKICS